VGTIILTSIECQRNFGIAGIRKIYSTFQYRSQQRMASLNVKGSATYYLVLSEDYRERC
jgi:hypothetical protein